VLETLSAEPLLQTESSLPLPLPHRRATFSHGDVHVRRHLVRSSTHPDS
jgi:hypothetical protein